MNFDPYNPKDFKRLRKSVEHNHKRMQPFRDVREWCNEAARGHYYDCEDGEQRTPDSISEMDQWVNGIIRTFIQATPKVRVTSREDPRSAAIFSARLNELSIETDIVSTFKRCAREALLGYMGVSYVGIEATDLDPDGASFADPIAFPDYCVDMARDSFKLIDHESHRYQRRIEEIEDSSLYDPEGIEHAMEKHNEWLERKGDKHKDDIDSLFHWTTVWQTLVYPANAVVTYADIEGVEVPLRVEQYDGPVYGPYVRLGFDDVLDGLLPNSRGALALDLHNFVNSQYRRIFYKEDQTAEVFFATPGMEGDARKFKNAGDGEVISADPNAVTRKRKGGTNPQALGTAIHSRQLFDDATGFVRSTGPTSNTARGEMISSQKQGALVRDMRNTFMAFAQKVYQCMAWYEWTNPSRVQRVNAELRPGVVTEELWAPQVRQGDFTRFKIEIIPESFEFRSSEEQAARVMRTVQGVVIPAMQLPSKKPVVMNAPGLVERYAELEGVDKELSGFVEFSDDAVNNGGGPARIPAGATTEGRLNGGARPAQDNTQQLLSAALSGAGQQQEDDE